MDEKGTPAYMGEGQQIPPTEYAPAEPQPQQPAAAQPQYTYTPYNSAPQQAQPQYQQPQQGQYNPYAQYGQPQQYAQYGQPQQGQYQQPYGQQPQYAPYGQQPQYAPQQPQKAPKAPKVKRGGAHGGSGGPNLPKWLIPAAAGAVALIVVIVLAVSLLGGGTEDKITNAAMGTMEKLASNEVVSTAQQAINGGSLTVSIDGTDLISQLSGMDMEATAEMKFWLDVEGGKTAMQITADIMDTAIDAGLYVNEESFAIASDVLLGDDAYGINITKLVENLEDSVFGPDGPYYLGDTLDIGDDQYEMIVAALSGEAVDTKAAEKLYNDGYKLAEDYVDFVIKTVFEHALVEKENDTVKIGSEKVKAQIINVTVDAPAMIEIANDVLEKIDGDKKLNKFLYAAADMMDETLENMDMDAMDYADAIDEFYDMVEEALDTVDDAREDAEDVDMELEFEFWLKGNDLLGMKADMAGTELEVKIGPDPKDPQLISVKMDDGWTKNEIVYEVEENDAEKFEAVFSMTEDEYELVNMTVSYDKEDGDWELSVYDGWDTYGIAGNLEINKDVYTITFTGLLGEYVPEEANMVLEMITVTIDTDDKAPDVPKYTDILTLDEDEFNEVIETIAEAVQELGEGMMGSVEAETGYATEEMPAVAYGG